MYSFRYRGREWVTQDLRFLVKAALAVRSPKAIGHAALPSLKALYVSKPGYRSPATCR